MKPAILLLAAAAGASALAPSANAQALLVPAQSEITFTTHQMGVPVDGRFTRFTASVSLDPKALAAGNVALTIDTGSARFGAAELDAEVIKPDWLSSAAFPQATFRSSAIKADGAGRYAVTGTLSIKGSARTVTVPVQLARAAPLTLASGTFTLQRLDFKVGAGDWSDPSLVADAVAVHFKLAFSGLAAP